MRQYKANIMGGMIGDTLLFGDGKTLLTACCRLFDRDVLYALLRMT